MIVKTTHGSVVSLVDLDRRKNLIDSNGVVWERDASIDDPIGRRAGYIDSKSGCSWLLLTVPELKRICDGPRAMNTPTTVEELRLVAEKMSPRQYEIVCNWPDQRFREILIEAEERGRNPAVLLDVYVANEMHRDDPPPDVHGEAVPLASEKPKTGSRYRNTPRPRKQKESLSVALEDVTVVLTPKQVEFLERMSECPGWSKPDGGGIGGTYILGRYAEELSDTMNAMSVGAVATTLREKHILNTAKGRSDGAKCCHFWFTDLGKRVYIKLSDRDQWKGDAEK